MLSYARRLPSRSVCTMASFGTEPWHISWWTYLAWGVYAVNNMGNCAQRQQEGTDPGHLYYLRSPAIFGESRAGSGYATNRQAFLDVKLVWTPGTIEDVKSTAGQRLHKEGLFLTYPWERAAFEFFLQFNCWCPKFHSVSTSACNSVAVGAVMVSGYRQHLLGEVLFLLD